MGANGSHASGILNTEEGRQWRTLFTIGDNIKVLEQKNPKQGGKTPEESRTPNRIYATLFKDGTNIKQIARYGPDGKKMYVIHNEEHKGLKPHYHEWKNGREDPNPKPLTSEMSALLKKIQDYER